MSPIKTISKSDGRFVVASKKLSVLSLKFVNEKIVLKLSSALIKAAVVATEIKRS